MLSEKEISFLLLGFLEIGSTEDFIGETKGSMVGVLGFSIWEVISRRLGEALGWEEADLFSLLEEEKRTGSISVETTTLRGDTVNGRSITAKEEIKMYFSSG
jgi:hypothetical protein